MRLGLGLSVQQPPEDPQATWFAEHLAQVRAARAAGFSHVWASQHYVAAPYTYFQPLPTLGRVAAEAGEMWLGTGVLLLPLHAPVDVAEQIATLDVITGGRFIFGVGLGYRDVEKTALAEARPFLEGKYAAYRAWEQDKALPAGETFAHDFDTLTRDRFLIGDPERVREEIARYQERLGITDLIVRVQWPGMDPARVLRSIRLLGDEVLPRLV